VAANHATKNTHRGVSRARRTVRGGGAIVVSGQATIDLRDWLWGRPG